MSNSIQTLYHITPTKNLNSIKVVGLRPQLGPNATKLGESKPGIWLFSTRQAAKDALGSWLGDQLDDLLSETETASLITLQLPIDWPLKSDVEYEKVSRQIIPAKYITKIERCW